MNAIEDYLCQVGRWMPPRRREEVLHRIREDLEEIIGEDRDGADVAQRLRAFGRPPVVAARYADYPHLIPGMLAPAYFVVLLTTVAALLLVNLSLMIPRALHGEAWPNNIAQVFATSFSAVPWAFTVITIVFSLLGYWAQRGARRRPG